MRGKANLAPTKFLEELIRVSQKKQQLHKVCMLKYRKTFFKAYNKAAIGLKNSQKSLNQSSNGPPTKDTLAIIPNKPNMAIYIPLRPNSARSSGFSSMASLNGAISWAVTTSIAKIGAANRANIANDLSKNSRHS